MATFIIDTENNITALGQQEAHNGESFGSQEQLAELAAHWPGTRLVEIWNGVPGLTPVKRFTDRKSAVRRIWRAIQNLDGETPAESANSASKRSDKPQRAAKATLQKAPKAKRTRAGRKGTVTRGSKKARIVALLQRKGGATLTNIMEATGWQAHSVRGFISGTLGKKMGLKVNSTRREDGKRVYTIIG